MIRGIVNSTLVAVVDLEVLGPSGSAARINAEVDTGFSGFLALERGVFENLQLRKVGIIQGMLADGSFGRFEAHLVTLDWHGAVRTVTAIESNGGTLLGTALLNNSLLTIEVRTSGAVTIEPL